MPDDDQIADIAAHAVDGHPEDLDGDDTPEKIADAGEKIRSAIQDGEVWDLPGGRTGFTGGGYVVIHTPIKDGAEENPDQGTAFKHDDPDAYMRQQQGQRPDRQFGS